MYTHMFMRVNDCVSYLLLPKCQTSLELHTYFIEFRAPHVPLGTITRLFALEIFLMSSTRPCCFNTPFKKPSQNAV